jgi:hypothetical protein
MAGHDETRQGDFPYRAFNCGMAGPGKTQHDIMRQGDIHLSIIPVHLTRPGQITRGTAGQCETRLNKTRQYSLSIIYCGTTGQDAAGRDETRQGNFYEHHKAD